MHLGLDLVHALGELVVGGVDGLVEQALCVPHLRHEVGEQAIVEFMVPHADGLQLGSQLRDGGAIDCEGEAAVWCVSLRKAWEGIL